MGEGWGEGQGWVGDKGLGLRTCRYGSLTCVCRCYRARRTAVAVQTGLLAGVAAAVIIVIALLVVGFFVYRRTVTAKQKKLLEEYSSQLQMVSTVVVGRAPSRAPFLQPAH